LVVVTFFLVLAVVVRAPEEAYHEKGANDEADELRPTQTSNTTSSTPLFKCNNRTRIPISRWALSNARRRKRCREVWDIPFRGRHRWEVVRVLGTR
jgi:hypothetical protein